MYANTVIYLEMIFMTKQITYDHEKVQTYHE